MIQNTRSPGKTQRLSSTSRQASDFLSALVDAGFKGDVASDSATRITFATDNSIYQIPPQAVIYPFEGSDLSLAMQVAADPAFKSIPFIPRGGGTGANGQSLGNGIIVDTSRHMRRVLDFDAKNRLIKVEPGLIRDALINFLEPHGFFFPPHVSTTSRATIGGMVSNDSSGKGSVIYGKTSKHIEALEIILPDGSEFEIRAQSKDELASLPGKSGDISRSVAGIISPHQNEIAKVFPKLKRGFTGYNLKDAIDDDDNINLPYLIAGSEGTLCLIKSITCRVTPIPAHVALVALRYPSHDAGLRAVPGLLSVNPAAIEFIDDNILRLAANSHFKGPMQTALGEKPNDPVAGAAHFVELHANSAGKLTETLNNFVVYLDALKNTNMAPIGYRIARDKNEIDQIWDIRKSCQGLLAGLETNKRAVAFVEDCVVPPENLADFVADLSRMLHEKNIAVGMYGHADVGCVHIRPLLDLTIEEDRSQIRSISDKVFKLTQHYGGLLWGEHGKGLRGEYNAKMIGENLTDVMSQIKAAFDPDNRLNPGKLAAPPGNKEGLIKIDAAPMRGHYDQEISPALREAFPKATHCNGNGACFNLDDSLPFCPSYKATGDRRFSPKGRAAVIREWMRLRSFDEDIQDSEFAESAFSTLETCLSCKSCSGTACPARIDIPTMRSRFLEWYYTRKRRPFADHIVANLEQFAPLTAWFAPVINFAQSLGLVKWLAKTRLGLVDLPKLAQRSFQSRLDALKIECLSATQILQLTVDQQKKAVVIIQDCYTSFYDADAALSQITLIQKLGYRPIVLRYRAGGKPLHVKGFLKRFNKLAHINASEFSKLASTGFTLLGMDGATTLMYRHEYSEVNKSYPKYQVLMLSEWLMKISLPKASPLHNFKMIQHCTEKSLHPEMEKQWIQIFDKMGIPLEIIKAGCCGMAGLFGHETAHQEISTTLFDQSWRNGVEQTDSGAFLATGYSCRSQVKRFSQESAKHPVEALLESLRQDKIH